MGDDSFQGVTSFSRPLPPPPLPQSPPPSSPPPFTFEACRTGVEVCYAFFLVGVNNTYTFDCSGTAVQIADKRTLGLCAPTQLAGAQDVCSDGGYDAHALLWTGKNQFARTQAAVRFGCDYGSQCATCGGPRTRDAVIDIQCASSSDYANGKCRDSCFVATDGTVVNEEEKFYTGTLTPDTLCHDGGPGSVDGKCSYGSQVPLASPFYQPP